MRIKKTCCLGAGGMVKWVKVLITKSEDVSSIAKNPSGEERGLTTTSSSLTSTYGPWHVDNTTDRKLSKSKVESFLNKLRS